MPTINVTPQVEQDTVVTPGEEQVTTEDVAIPQNKEKETIAQTYSKEELNDPEAIDVDIADDRTPIAVLFGPPASGKTMTMIRLAKFLTVKGYSVEPVRSFRKDYDNNYTSNCANFNGMLSEQQYKWAAEKSLGLNFMLLKVSRGGTPIVQILEAPGEHYYDPNDRSEPKSEFISYIQKVINAPNRKLWIYMTEPNWKNRGDRENYSRKVASMKTKTDSRDKSILLFNKVDTTNFVQRMGEVNQKAAEQHVSNMYPGLFDCFKNQNPITSMWKPYACTLVPFSTGTYTEILIEGKKRKKFTEGPNAYTLKLWNTILKSIGLPQIN